MNIRFFLLAAVSIFFAACQPNETSDNTAKTTTTAASDNPVFQLLTKDQTGLDFINFIKETPQHNPLVYEYFYNGGGVSIGDVNNDGKPDLYFTGNLTQNKLYLNMGDLKFKDVTKAAGVEGTNSWCSGSTMVDINADGWLDIYVTRSYLDLRPKSINNLFYINNGDGTFTNKAKELGLDDNGFGTQTTFFDMDLDGDLDCFVGNHAVDFRPANIQEHYDQFFKPDQERFSDKLFRNDGGKFTDISKESGIFNYGFTLGVVSSDLNGDGWPDLYVASDYEIPDRMYINNKNGTFTDKTNDNLDHIAQFAMGVDAADFNNDGMIDLAVLDMAPKDNYRSKTQMPSMNIPFFRQLISQGFQHQYMRNVLQVNNGNRKGEGTSFSEIGQMAGMDKTDWSWAPLFQDYDNDGHKDLFISNGYRRDARFVDANRKMREKYGGKTSYTQEEVDEILSWLPSTKMVNYFFKNNGDLTFKDVSKSNGVDVPSFSQGAAYGDLDGDGDLEIVVNNIEDHPFIYKNNSVENGSGNYFQVELKGSGENVTGLGAKVEIQTADGKQFIDNTLSRGYQSSMENLIHFGIGDAKKVDKLTVRWIDGTVNVLENVRANTRMKINQTEGTKQPMLEDSATKLFADATSKTGVSKKHSEVEYDDFIREILIPHKMSTAGPALATADWNGDGLEEFYVGGGSGQSGTLYVQTADGKMNPVSGGAWSANKNCEESAAHFFDADGDGDLDLYVSSGSNEFNNGSANYQDHLYFQTAPMIFAEKVGALPDLKFSSDRPVSGDIDGDGDLDLFVCGRQDPGSYPRPGTSALLLNEGGTFKNVTDDWSADLKNIGMVSDAALADFNKDGNTDLLLVGEWMSPTLFTGNGAAFAKSAAGLEDEIGWWFSLQPADIDKDGDLDFVAGNLGLNYKYRADKATPFPIYSNDFDKNGKLDIVLGYSDGTSVFPLRGRECSSQQCPQIKEKFPTYHDFGKATLSDVYGSDLETALSYEANNFASSYFENMGDGKFKIHALPNAAQVAPVNGIVVEDFNKDNHLDLVVAGNLYGSEIETGRADAGKGLFLAGDGKGNFKASPVSESGLYIPGDVKNIKGLKTANGTRLVAAKANGVLQFVEVNSGNSMR